MCIVLFVFYFCMEVVKASKYEIEYDIHKYVFIFKTYRGSGSSSTESAMVHHLVFTVAQNGQAKRCL